MKNRMKRFFSGRKRQRGMEEILMRGSKQPISLLVAAIINEIRHTSDYKY